MQLSQSSHQSELIARSKTLYQILPNKLPDFQKSNFRDVVPAMLVKDDYQTLLLQAGSVDITNLNTKENQSEHMDYYRQETVMSAKNLIQTATNALSTSSTLKKVIIMKHIPRYDPVSTVPVVQQYADRTVDGQFA